MTRGELLAFMRRYRVAVQSSVSAAAAPQAAIVGVAIGDDFEIVFDTLGSTRKATNLRRDARIALVLGGWGQGEARTVQLEGVADEPTGAELARVRELYFGTYPDGRDRLAWPGITHFRVRPTLLRYSDFATTPETIVELAAGDLAALG